ncbi:hypothetical protein KXD93_30475, partial [Mucilaginibacter sp. BJC16-A38]|uniref:hypothetical protein n=1 Tax=Mucilaginibacter phenanthrenivorans TaxID=1234842 RepID=UPI002157BDE4
NLYVKRQFGITDERGKVWDTGYDLVKVQANQGGRGQVYVLLTHGLFITVGKQRRGMVIS